MINFGIFRKTSSLVFILIVLTFTAYSFTLNGSFKTLDDEFSIVKNEEIRDFSNLKNIFTSSFFGGRSYYRPLVATSFMLEYHLFKLNAFYYYLNNVIIHILNGLILFWLLSLIFNRTFFAFAVSVLYSIHPVHWEAVSNIAGRSILLCAFFSYLVFVCFCLSEKRKGFYYLAFPLFILGLFSKESAGVLPIVLLSYLFFIRRKPGESVLCIIKPIIPFLCINVVYVLMRRSFGITQLFHWRSIPEAFLGFFTFLRSAITHLRLFIFPVDMQFDRSRAVFVHFMQLELLLTLAFFGCIVFLIVKFHNRISREVKFFLSWACIDMIPVSQFFVTIGVQPGFISTAEHFLYTASVGVFVVLVLGIKKIYELNEERKFFSGEMLQAIIIGFYAFFFLITIQCNIYSSNEIAMFERSLALNPANVRIRYNLANAYAKVGRFQEAETHFREVLNITSNVPRVEIALGKALCDQGKFWECLNQYESIQNAGKYEGLLERNKWGTYSYLEYRYKKLLKEKPNDALVYYSLGVVYSKTERFEETIELYKKAIQLSPKYKNAHFNLAASYEALNQLPQAAEHYQKVISLSADLVDHLDVKAYDRLSVIYKILGDSEKASQYNLLADRHRRKLK